MIVLNTRPAPQAARFHAQLAAWFGTRAEVVDTPLMARVFLPPPAPWPVGREAVVLTSETGAEAAGLARAQGMCLPDLAFCVGARTAKAAALAGFAPISAEGDARDLLALIAARPERRLLYMHGADRAADLGAALRPLGFDVVDVVAYRQEALGLSQAARRALGGGGPVVVPLFSPRSSRLFCDHLNDFSLEGVWPVVISENARKTLAEPLRARAFVAQRPDGAAMLEAIRDCFRALDVLNPRPRRD